MFGRAGDQYGQMRKRGCQCEREEREVASYLPVTLMVTFVPVLQTMDGVTDSSVGESYT